jgi:hypothetical protein
VLSIQFLADFPGRRVRSTRERETRAFTRHVKAKEKEFRKQVRGFAIDVSCGFEE